MEVVVSDDDDDDDEGPSSAAKPAAKRAAAPKYPKVTGVTPLSNGWTAEPPGFLYK